jgi:hypothetical protein
LNSHFTKEDTQIASKHKKTFNIVSHPRKVNQNHREDTLYTSLDVYNQKRIQDRGCSSVVKPLDLVSKALNLILSNTHAHAHTHACTPLGTHTRLIVTSVGEDVKKQESPNTSGGNQNSATTLENSLALC